jgi:hypothetical protein
MDIAQFYLSYSIRALWVLLLLMIASILLIFFGNGRSFAKECSRIKNRTWIFLFVILMGAFLTQWFFHPTMHLLYIDEHLYMGSAKNINELGQAVNCRFEWGDVCQPIVQKAPAWPFILSLSFRAFGDSAQVAFFTVKIISLLTIFLSFFFCFVVLKSERVGLWTAFFLASSPLYLQWSGTADAAIPSLFFTLLTLFSCAIFLKSKQAGFGILTLTLLLFSVLIRYEHILLLPILLLLFAQQAHASPKPLKRISMLFLPSLFAIALLFELVMLFQGLDFFRPTISSFLPELYVFESLRFIKMISFGFLLLIPSFFGAWFLWKDKASSSFILFPLMLYSALYLPLSYETRFLLIPFFFMCVLAALGIETALSRLGLRGKIHNGIRAAVMGFVLLGSLLSPYPLEGHLREKLPLYSLEHQSASLLSSHVPQHCYIISEYASITTAVAKSKGIRTNHAISNPAAINALLSKGNCAFYFEDMYCSLKEGNFGRDCTAMHTLFNLTLAHQFSDQKEKFTLYRVKARGSPLSNQGESNGT